MRSLNQKFISICMVSNFFSNILEDVIDINQPKTGGHKSNVKMVNILYCVAWYYRSTFDSIAKYIESKNPSVTVTGDEYPAPTLNQYAASFVGYAQTAIITLAVFGETIMQKLGIEAPELAKTFFEKKTMLCLITFLVGSIVKTQLLSTGAFEIYFDDEVVFSKLQTGEPPTMEILESLLHSHQLL